MSQENSDFAEGPPPDPKPKTDGHAPAFCPRCKGAIGLSERTCPHCGHNFPLRKPNHEHGIVYSPTADLALVVGTIVAGLGCLASVILSIVLFFRGEFANALILCPLAFFLQLAMLVVFVRVQRITPP
jgi:hypothetical protein